MRGRTIYSLIRFSLLVSAGVFLLELLLLSMWRVGSMPEIFPRALAHGLLTESLSWSEAFRLSLALSLLAGILSYGINKRAGGTEA